MAFSLGRLQARDARWRLRVLGRLLDRYSRKINLVSLLRERARARDVVIYPLSLPNPPSLSLPLAGQHFRHRLRDVPRCASVPRKKSAALGRNVITVCYLACFSQRPQ